MLHECVVRGTIEPLPMLLNVSDSTSLFIFFLLLSDVVYPLNSYSYDEPVHHIMHEHESGDEREVLKRLKLFLYALIFFFFILHTETMKWWWWWLSLDCIMSFGQDKHKRRYLWQWSALHSVFVNVIFSNNRLFCRRVDMVFLAIRLFVVGGGRRQRWHKFTMWTSCIVTIVIYNSFSIRMHRRHKGLGVFSLLQRVLA